MAEQENNILEPDLQLMVEIRQSVLSKTLTKQQVSAALDFMQKWNNNRPSPEQ